MTLEIIPSIDLLGGKVVRLERGNYKAVTVFSSDPVGTAADFETQGASRIHVVDLDGSKTGKPANKKAVQQIVEEVSIPVQVAGGIRTVAAAQEWLDNGAARVVLGTKALTDADFLAEVIEAIGDQLIVAPDAKAGVVQVAGWQEGTGEDVIDAVHRLVAAGVPRLLVTDIGVDGMLEGPNTSLLNDVVEAAGIPIIASGGVSSIDDLLELANMPGIEGVIVGRALYVGAFELDDAVKVIR